MQNVARKKKQKKERIEKPNEKTYNFDGSAQPRSQVNLSIGDWLRSVWHLLVWKKTHAGSTYPKKTHKMRLQLSSNGTKMLFIKGSYFSCSYKMAAFM